MDEMTDELLARIAERARDPKRRYMKAAEDEARIELPVEEIERREEEWTRRNLARSAAASGEEISAEDVERYMDEWRASRDAARRDMEAQMRAWGQTPPKTKSFIETEHYIRASSEPPGARPLQPPPTENDWKALERIVGRSVPEDLKRLYTISDGGFGPGFTGLNAVQLIGAGCEDHRRRGPDYCGTVPYSESFIPLATERLGYHYDLDTGRIISSNAHWEDEELEPDDIYAIAFQSLAAMMEDWLSRS
ncbi:SMI1/KNR4 family protein [Microvirga arabica]|uniref:SMI1/KNR4 family protein n=1 Tax=Microvirga arabica TaxID=1128671 RepID=UPI001939892C|nr:SMI1/KNR4 family protein [Microvirga arabica]MBM1172048.1 SMI1/KNR4 family protein [Microvirga arabica]